MENIIQRQKLEQDSLYFTIQDFRLKINECGFITAYKDLSNVDNRYFRLYYFLTDGVSFSIERKTIHFKRKTLLFLKPNQKFIIPKTPRHDVPYNMFYITFEIGNLAKRSEFFSSMKRNFPNQSVYDPNGILLKLFEEMHNQFSDKQKCAAGYAQHLFQLIIIQMFRLSETIIAQSQIKPRYSASDILLDRASDLMLSNLKLGLKMNEVADELGISDIYLYKLFKDKTGKSPLQFVSEHKILMAKEFLENRSYSIKEISNELGYSSSTHFSIAFKKATGFSPSYYRQMFC